MRFGFRAATALGTSLLGLVPGVGPVLAASAGGAHDWSGLYLGGTLGVVQSNAAGTATYPDAARGTGYVFNGGSLYYDGNTDPEATGLPTIFSLGDTAADVGVGAGYNLTAGNFVYGVEGDFRLLRGAGSSVTEQSLTGGATVTLDSSLDSLATLRARAGISADRLLLFATAGLATGQTSLSTNFDYTNSRLDSGKSAALSGNGSGWPVGYVAGAGAEYAVTDRISLEGEALYYNLGRTSVTATNAGSTFTLGGPPTPEPASPYTASVSQSGVIVESGINFHF